LIDITITTAGLFQSYNHESSICVLFFVNKTPNCLPVEISAQYHSG